MTESEHKLRTLLRIRNIRVNKQRATLKAKENTLNGKLNEQETLIRKIEEDRQAHQRQQREKTQQLLNNQSEIGAFLALKNNEEIYFCNNKKMTRQGDALVEQIQQSRFDYHTEQKKLKVVEKAVIKVEEFLKLEWE